MDLCSSNTSIHTPFSNKYTDRIKTSKLPGLRVKFKSSQSSKVTNQLNLVRQAPIHQMAFERKSNARQSSILKCLMQQLCQHSGHITLIIGVQIYTTLKSKLLPNIQLLCISQSAYAVYQVQLCKLSHPERQTQQPSEILKGEEAHDYQF